MSEHDDAFETFLVDTAPDLCDNCDEPIVHTSDDEYLSASIGPPEWVHTRSHGPECRRDERLIGGVAEPAWGDGTRRQRWT